VAVPRPLDSVYHSRLGKASSVDEEGFGQRDVGVGGRRWRAGGGVEDAIEGTFSRTATLCIYDSSVDTMARKKAEESVDSLVDHRGLGI
jgi:hypothetical protein